MDRETFTRYQLFPAERLGREVAAWIHIEPGTPPDALFARIHRLPSGACPFLDESSACQIHALYGERFLASSCSIYPRSLAWVHGGMEGTLNLSCPEAARSVLLCPDFLRRPGDLHAGSFRTDNACSLAERTLASGGTVDFIRIRARIIAVIRDRMLPVGERLLRLGRFCQDLDAARTQGDVDCALEALQDGAAVLRGSGQGSAAWKLRLAFELSEAQLRDGCGRRFEEVFLWFAQGLSPASGIESESEALARVQHDFYAPYIQQHPYLLENYLLNAMFQNLFPFGREGSADFIRQNAWDEFVQMAVRFAWLQTLLIGAAGFFGERFSSEHVIQVVQSFSREVEHYPSVLASFNNFARTHGLNDLQGMAMLLRT